MAARVAGALLAAALATGCSGGGSAAPAPAAPHPSTSARDFGLTGIGATRASWDANHSEDHQYSPGCCYLPRVDDAEHAGDDTWVTVQSQGSGYVYSYERRFPARTDVATAMQTLRREDLPADVRPVRHALHGACDYYLFASATLDRLPGQSRAPYVLVTLMPISTANSFAPTDVVYGDLAVWPNRSLPPC